ncbi:hypothetical protein N8528_00720 [Akkermansiaceae bacterium]|nr:hypothetical protein [Akkermansiaceae bacterium]
MKTINRHFRCLRLFAALSGFLFTQSPLMAQQDIGFIEDFALAENREEALKQLIPGTEDYYYYHALHFQNERKVDELKEILTQWEQQFKNSNQRKQIENREALIRYSDDPEATLAYLEKELGLQFNHQQEGKAREANHPSSLDQKLVSWKAFLDDARRNTENLQNLDESAFYLFLESKPKLTSIERRDLLSRATLPDLPGLLDLILADLKNRESKGFGEFSIHQVLTKVQLEKLLEEKKDLLNNELYVGTYLPKLLPGADENLASSPEIREAYLERAWKFASTLPPSFTSLKAHLLYQRLVHDRALGKENQKRFLTYLALPRNVSYLNPDWRKNKAVAWLNAADLGRDFRSITTLPPVRGSDESLVKAYLLHFLKDAPDTKKFAPFLSERWLRTVFAEAKITHGMGKPADWASLLSPSEFQALKDRVDIEFDATSREIYALDDEVTLKVHLKNVPKLIVKVFEINTLNYYRNRENELSTDIDLDGLVANHTETHEYQDAPQLRVAREFKIPSLEKRRGLWVVEFIGGGKSSRAVIRKGALGILNKTISKGELITVLDEKHQPVKGAGIWLGERRYDCDDQGRTILPFSNNPGTRSIVVEDADGFATLAKFNQPTEKYRLVAVMHLENEALRTGGMAKIIARPILSVAGETISLKQVTSATLQLSSTNLEGIPATTTVPDFKLMSDREAVHEFRVPDGITELVATLRVKVKVASKGGEEIELTSSETFKVNEFLGSERVGDLYLSKIGDNYRIEFLGRNGEPLSGQNLTVRVNHDGFKNQQNFTLKTNEVGGIDLGKLADISRVEIHEPSGHHRSWHLLGDRRDQVGTLTLAQGQALKVPFVGQLKKLEIAFFSTTVFGNVSDEFSKLKLDQGYLTANNLPAGDYRLLLKERKEVVNILVADGTVSKGHVFSDTRMLELPARQPSHIAGLKVEKDTLEIAVCGVDLLTRIHVIATRFLPDSDPFHNLRGSLRPGLTTGRARYLPSLYISGRNLGDELRYILERRYADKFPGNMLTRPEIILNPWAIRDTKAGEESLADGDKFDRKPVAPAASLMKGKGKSDSARKQMAAVLSPSFEFLAHAPVTVTNLVPDEHGKLSIKLDAFGNRQHIHVLLVDPDGATYRSVSLPDRETKLRDLRLLKALDQKRHFTEQERVTLLKKGDVLKLPDLVNAEFEVFDHLGSIHRYFLTLSENKTLREFEFITKWSSLTEEEKNDKYSKYACHELSFFLSRKDPAFFKAVVLPHLANKKDRTFMDDYLLGKPLEKYLEAYQYARLNVVERLLLSQSDPKRLAALALDLENRMALKAPNLDQSRYWFGTAFSGGAFGGGYAGGLIAESQMSVSQDDPFASDGEPRALGLKSRGAVIASASRRSAKLQKRALVELQNKSRESKSEYFGMDAFSDSEEELKELLPALQQLYRSLEPTKEWAENNYYQLRISEHNYDLVGENNFWLDLAKHGLKPGFGSRHLGEATGNFSEMMLALAFLDLPFDAPEHKDEIKGGDLTFTSGGPALLFHREIKEAGMAAKRPALLVSQSYFQLNDRFRMENGEKVDKFITEEFMRGIVYGSQVVVTNPTSSRQLLDILTQIPKGAIPVMAHRSTTNQQISLDPYSTHRLELTFYFPTSGEFPIYPAHLSKVGEVVAHADPLTFKVVDQPSSVDETSWTWISQWGEEALVLKYLETANLHATNLTKIAWRCRESNDFYKKAVAILDRRGIFERTLQSYALAHNDKAGIGQFLLVQSRFLNQCGMALSSELVTVDPIDRRSYEHLEYKPLINNRAHSLGGENRILNPVVRSQYQTYLTVLSQQKELDDRDQLGVTYYLFLQDRVSEALAHLAKVDAEKLETKIQFDYFQAYAAFYQADLGKARSIAKKYEKYPVDRWRERFAGITAQLAEIDGAGPEVIDDGNREQEQQAAASREPSLDLKIEGTKATLDFQNVAEVTMNYYEMDLEFLFSTNPFVSSGTSRFSIIQPNESTTMKLLKGKRTTSFDLPEKYRASNVIVEILGGGKTTSKAVYANELKTTLSESMGLLTVRHGKTGKALPKVYIKVYARTDEGVKFFKDGYTDLRGKFDYASVSSTGLGKVERFSILVMSEEQGATVLEASAPRR